MTPWGLAASRGIARAALAAGWHAAAAAPGTIADPGALDAAALDWVPATAPATAAPAAAAARRARFLVLDGPPRRFDAEDWWFRALLPAVDGEIASGDELALVLEGIATVADVWLDGAPLLASDNMWLAPRAPRRRPPRAGDNELVIRCRALEPLLAMKRPRPRWRAPMIENQQLRWFRTTLLGRTPGWSPPAAAVGPFRPIRIERRAAVAIDDVRVEARLEGAAGVVEVACRARAIGGGAIDAIELVVERAGRSHRVALRP